MKRTLTMSNTSIKAGVELAEIFTPLMLLTQFLDLHDDIQLLFCSQKMRQMFGPIFASVAQCRPSTALRRYGHFGASFVKKLLISELDDIKMLKVYKLHQSKLYFFADFTLLQELCLEPLDWVKDLTVHLYVSSEASIPFDVSFSNWVELESLTFSDNFTFLWAPGWLPPNLKHLDVGDEFNQRFHDQNLFPQSLQKLRLGRSFFISGNKWPKHLQSLTICNTSMALPNWELPNTLTDLCVHCVFFNCLTPLPSSLQRLEVHGSFDIRLDGHKFPASLTYLDFNAYKTANFSIIRNNSEKMMMSADVNLKSQTNIRFDLSINFGNTSSQNFLAHTPTTGIFDFFVSILAPQLHPIEQVPLCYTT